MLRIYENFMNVYDFDNTIYDGDSTFDFYIFSLKRHKKILFTIPSLIKSLLKFYLFKKGTKTELKQVMFRFLRYVNYPVDLEDFWKKHKKNIKEWYLNQQKNNDVVISASPEFLLQPICKELKIRYLFASIVDKNTGIYTGENCHGKEKVRVFRTAFKDIQIEEFYSDSKSDTPLAKISNKAFLVHGNNIKPWKF